MNKGAGVESIADFPYPIDAVAAVADFDGRGFHSFPVLLTLGLLCPFPLNLSCI